MAIDTAEKRKSSARHGPMGMFGPGVTLNALKDAEWRRQVGWGYSGIAAATVIISNAPQRTTVGAGT